MSGTSIIAKISMALSNIGPNVYALHSRNSIATYIMVISLISFAEASDFFLRV